MFRPAVTIFRFPQTIKTILYNLCEGVLMKRSLCINPLFALVSNVNRLYISNEEVFSISSVELGITVLGLHELLWQSLVYCILSLSFWGDPLCRWPWWIWSFHVFAVFCITLGPSSWFPCVSRGMYWILHYARVGTVTIWRYGQFIVFCTFVSTVCVCHKGTIADTPSPLVCFIHL